MESDNDWGWSLIISVKHFAYRLLLVIHLAILPLVSNELPKRHFTSPKGKKLIITELELCPWVWQGPKLCFELCFVCILAQNLFKSLFIQKNKMSFWVSFPTNISSHLWVPACNNCKLAEFIVSVNCEAGVPPRRTKTQEWERPDTRCALWICDFISEEHSWKISLTKETDALSPSPPARKAAIMSNISLFPSLPTFMALTAR